jgi:hypothetical protein
MGALFTTAIKEILIFALVLILSGHGISGRSAIQRNGAGINEAYLGCLMYGSDILECQDLTGCCPKAFYDSHSTSL